jgi:MOSC domain-containing protein YiiM
VSARVVSVRVGRIRAMPRPDWDHHAEREWSSAYLKDSVAGPVPVGPLGLEGDEQFDRVSHGGPDKAVLAYSADHYPAWRDELGIAEFGPGAFGENLTVTGLDETQVCVGERWTVGEVTLEVSQPRGPCANISRRWNREDLLKRVTDSRRGGWYLRVITPGRLATGDIVERHPAASPEWTVDRVFALFARQLDDPEAVRTLADLAPLASRWRGYFGRRLTSPAG